MKRKILIVDDSKSIVILLQDFLTSEGYEVVVAYDGQEALDIIQKNPIPVVLTDIQMPNMDGIELIENIKNTYPMIRVIIGTGYVEFKYGLSAFTNGAETILFKPYNLEQLKATIDKSFAFLDEWEKKLKELQEMKKETEEATGGSETILYIDDDEKVKKFAKFNLEKAGYTFISVSNGIEAFGLIKNAENVDLILTSVKLEDMTGKEIYKNFKKANPDIKVLYVVSYKEEHIFEDNVLHEKDDYIYFPFTRKILTKSVRKTLDE